ncbi:MAG TPA: alkaline phosphatase family protein [Gemmatimonadaceae bacterium]|nr:alkaline phosphatase family protein [Gemmatimonadaceae bacterium]
MNPIRRSMIFIGALVFSACAANPAPATPVETAPDQKPTLVVMVLVDQLRADLLDKYGDLWTGGFKRLRTQGHDYVSATHDHAVTETAVGHAALSTGVYPSRHGIVSNAWYELRDGKWILVSNVGDEGAKIIGQPTLPGASPVNLMRTGLADWIIKADSKSIIASASGKDRGAIQPAAHAKNGYVYWWDPTVGKFVTSTYYRDSNPSWIDSFNEGVQQRYRSDTVWASRIPASMLGRSNKDSSESEGDGVHTAFPHAFASEGSPNAFWAWWTATPANDAATIELAETMVTSLALGRDNSPDFLNLSVSVTDRVGHAFGPNSREQLDNLLRLDKELGAFLDFLDKTVGKNKWTVMLTADHGILDTPEDLQARGEYGHRITASERKTLDSLRLDADQAKDPKAAAVKLRDALKKLRIVGDAWTQEQLGRGQPADSFEVLQRRSLFPGRKPGSFSRQGVEMRLIPGVLYAARGSSHGTTYYYDRHVPMIFMGPGIPAGRDASRAQTVDFAPTIAKILRIPFPGDLDGHPLTAVSH